MIWATVSSQSCFCWLCRASPYLAATNIISLISVLTFWSIPWSVLTICRVICCDVGRGCFLQPAYSLGKTLLAFALLHLYSTAKLVHYSRYLLTSYFCIPVPYDEKDVFFGVISKRSFSVIEPLNFTFSGISGWSIDLDYCNLEWSADEQEIILSFFRMHPSTAFWNLFFFFLLWGLLHFF